MDVKTETTVFIDVAEHPSEIVVSDGDTRIKVSLTFVTSVGQSWMSKQRLQSS
jgi:hypothetical protein